MTDDTRPASHHPADDFARLAEAPSYGLIREFYDLMRYNKKWWLLPILVVLLVFGVLVFLGGTPAAPLIYTLF